MSDVGPHLGTFTKRILSNRVLCFRSCSKKLIALQKITKTEAAVEEYSSVKLKKRKSWPKKKFTRNSKTDDEQVIITDWTDLVQRSTKTKKNQ